MYDEHVEGYTIPGRIFDSNCKLFLLYEFFIYLFVHFLIS